MGLTQRDSGGTIGDSTPQQAAGTTWPAGVWQSLLGMQSVMKRHQPVLKPSSGTNARAGEINVIVGVIGPKGQPRVDRPQCLYEA